MVAAKHSGIRQTSSKNNLLSSTKVILGSKTHLMMTFNLQVRLETNTAHFQSNQPEISARTPQCLDLGERVAEPDTRLALRSCRVSSSIPRETTQPVRYLQTLFLVRSLQFLLPSYTNMPICRPALVP